MTVADRPGPTRTRPTPAGLGPLPAFVRRHPLLVLMLVFNTLGQATVLVPMLLNRRAGADLDIEVLQSVSLVLFLLVPALLITRRAHGRPRLRALMRDAVRFDVPLRWYLIPLLVVPLVGLAATLAVPPSGAAVPSAYVTAFLPALALQFVSTNWWEEVVWTGVVQLTLQERYGALRAALLTAPLFALEHVFLTLDGTVREGVVLMALLTVALVFVRALFGWIYNSTGSLALAGLVHAASNATALALVPELYGHAGDGILGMLLLGLVVVPATRGRLGQSRRARREYAGA